MSKQDVALREVLQQVETPVVKVDRSKIFSE